MWYLFQKIGKLVVLINLVVVTTGCTGDNDREGAGQSMPQTATADTHSAALPVAASRQVVIDNFTFNPPRLVIPAGTKVTWINRDDVPHTATSTAKPKQFDSGALDTDQQFSHAFAAPGIYNYFCAVHPKMTGQIIVE